jgi:hypothetical protein
VPAAAPDDADAFAGRFLGRAVGMGRAENCGSVTGSHQLRGHPLDVDF